MSAYYTDYNLASGPSSDGERVLTRDALRGDGGEMVARNDDDWTISRQVGN